MKLRITPKRFLIVTFSVWLIAFSVLPLFNYVVDVARVFHGDEQFYVAPVVREENKRISRMRFLRKHKEQFNNYVAGSSRVYAGIATATMGGNWHKLNYPGGSIDEHLHNLQVLKEWGMLPKQLLLSIEEISLYNAGNTTTDYFTRSLPIDAQASWDFWKFYLFRRPSKKDFDLFIDGKLAPARWLSMGAAYGENKNPEVLPFLSPYQSKYAHKQTQLPWVLADIAAIRELCPTFPFVTPRHYKTLALRNFDDLYTFNYLLAQQGSFWDFRPFTSPLLLDNRVWKETSHFNHLLGRELVKKWKGINSEVGVVITKENVTEEFIKMVRGIQRQIPWLLMKDPMMRIHPTLLASENIFTLDEGKQFSRVEGLAHKSQSKTFTFTAKGTPTITLPAVAWNATTPVLLKVKAEVPSPVFFAASVNNKVFYKRRLDTRESMEKLRKGPLKPFAFTYFPRKVQEFYVPITKELFPALRAGNQIRLHFGNAKGTYTVREVSIWPFRNWQPPQLQKNMVQFCLAEESVFAAGTHAKVPFWSVVTGSRNVRKMPQAGAVEAFPNAPQFLFKVPAAHEGEHIFMVEMDVTKDTPVTLFWDQGSGYTKKHSITQVLTGDDKEKRLYFKLPPSYQGTEVMLQTGSKHGVYHIRNLELRKIGKTL